MLAEFNRIFIDNTLKKRTNKEGISFQNKKTTSDEPWMTKEIELLIDEKHRNFRDYKMTKN